jgi:hypothetical protein
MEEEIILTQGFKGFSSSWWEELDGTVQFTSWQLGNRERNTGRDQGKIWPQEHVPTDLLPPTRPHLLNVLWWTFHTQPMANLSETFLTSTTTAKIQKTCNIKCWQECGITGILRNWLYENRMVQ